MALKTSDLKAAEAAATTKPSTDKTEAAPNTGYVLLVLHLYKRYHRHGELYEKHNGAGELNVYRFTREQAVILLDEMDGDRRIWRVFRPEKKEVPKPKATILSENAVNIKDATGKSIKETEWDEAPPKRIDIGNDEEIASLLETGNVVEV